MKCLAIDSSVSKITITCCNEDLCVSGIYNIGMKQSETILPAIEYVLSKAGLKTTELEYLALCSGPGSFTGLRLGFSALKAIELACNIPLYAFNTLDVYSENFKNFPFPVISCIDAKKDRFYAKIINGKSELLEAGDYTPEEISTKLAELTEEKFFICGSDSAILKEQISSLCSKEFIDIPFTINPGEILIEMTKDAVSKGKEPLNDYDGPVYLRASEAEVKLNQ